MTRLRKAIQDHKEQNSGETLLALISVSASVMKSGEGLAWSQVINIVEQETNTDLSSYKPR